MTAEDEGGKLLGVEAHVGYHLSNKLPTLPVRVIQELVK